MSTYFSDIPAIAYEGPQSTNPLAFRWYDKDRLVMGQRMEDHLRIGTASCIFEKWRHV